MGRGRERGVQRGAFFHIFLNEFITNVFKDELNLLGEGYFESYASLKYLTHRKLRQILQGEPSSWLDDVSTVGKYETLEDNILKSFQDAYESVKKIRT